MSDSKHEGEPDSAQGLLGVGDQTVEEILTAVAGVLSEARPIRMSANVTLPRDELLVAIEGAVERIPDELRAARWLLKEREEYLAAGHAEAAEIVAEARAQAEQMVRRTELVRQSELYGRRIRDEAEAEARHRRRQTEDYCEQRLAHFETTLSKIAKAVQQGRERLRALPTVAAEEGAGDSAHGRDASVIDLTDERVAGGRVLFDQDIE